MMRKITINCFALCYKAILKSDLLMEIGMKALMPVVASLFCICGFSGGASADKLPKSGVAMSAADVTALYSDHTAVWAATAMAYFAPDGSVKQLGQGISKPGQWSVKDNEFCMDIQGVDPKTKKLVGKTFKDCWQWFKDDKNHSYSLYSKHWDNAKPDLTNYDSKQAKILKQGDLIGAKYVAPSN